MGRIHEVLTPEQCVKMRLFLSSLLAAAKTLPLGQKSDATCFPGCTVGGMRCR